MLTPAEQGIIAGKGDAADSVYSGDLTTWTPATRTAAADALSRCVQPHNYTAKRFGFAVHRISAKQYGEVIDALTAAGQPGTEWNFPLD